MAHALPPRMLATAADLAALPEAVAAEVVSGVVVPSPMPDFEHAEVQGWLSEWLEPFRTRRAGAPGGWWICSTVDVEFDTYDVYCPDLVGWRWESASAVPTGQPIRQRPDWVCEVLSPATARRDRVEKLRTYLRVGVPSYWLVDPVDRTLLVYRRTAEGYLLSLAAGTPIVLRAEPFEAALLPLKSLFGGDDAGNGG